MSSKIDMQQIEYIHAHTLFSDGGLAYLAKKKYGIGYSVAVRNTDYNLFVRFLKHTHLYGRKILLNADKVYFISKGIKDGFVRSSFAQPLLDQMLNKICVQPNGIDEYWCHNISRTSPKGHSVLYIGDFSKNKNVERLIQAVLHLSKEDKYKDIRLILVGGGTKKGDRDATESITQLIYENSSIIQYKGKIFDKEQLRKVMSSCALFAMPSIHETFGLVYVEALSQNLPVIYTKGQGIDGMFDNHVGVGVNPYFVNEIERAITAIFDNYTYYGNESIDFNCFDWNVIAARYKNDYEMGASAI